MIVYLFNGYIICVFGYVFVSFFLWEFSDSFGVGNVYKGVVLFFFFGVYYVVIF